MSWADWLARAAAERESSGLARHIRPRGADDPVLDCAGNDYLGLSRHPEVREAAARAALAWGAGAGASPLVTGSLDLHHELEEELAALTGLPTGLVMSTGYHANLSVVTALAGRDCLVVSDGHIHASLVDACRLSRAEVVVTPHADVDAVSAALARADGRRALVLAESVYSVLGDAAPLLDLADLTASYGALLVVDEAHGIGVAGQGGHGLVRELGLHDRDHVVVTATLSKALGAQGGAVLGCGSVREHLVNRARPFIFDTGLAPAAAGGALAAVRLLRERPDLPVLVRRRVRDLSASLGVEAPAGAVLSVPMPSPQLAVAARDAALVEGVRVGCFRPPSVPDGVSRLRITANAGIADADWARAVSVLGQVVKEHQ